MRKGESPLGTGHGQQSKAGDDRRPSAVALKPVIAHLFLYVVSGIRKPAMTTTTNTNTNNSALELLTNEEAASLLGIRPNTLEIWRTKGKGPEFVKMGKQKQAPIRYLRQKIITWLPPSPSSQSALHNHPCAP